MGTVDAARHAVARGLTMPIVCPACRASLPPLDAWPEEAVPCRGCGRPYRTVGGIPRFVDTDGYVENFSFEWLRHRKTQLDAGTDDESERTFRAKTGLLPEDVKGQLVLDAGCGMGRFAEVVSRWGGRVVAVDLSRAVEAAQENLAGRDVLVCQADLSQLPFPEGSFDLIYSVGVLHHTPNCEQAFRTLVRYLAPGGTIAIWVYPKLVGQWARSSEFYRWFTTRMPRRFLHALCHVAVPCYYLFKIPVIGRPLASLLPLSEHPKAEWRVLDTFDWYSPRYQSTHTYPEVYGWFLSEGLTRIRLLEVPVSVSGVKSEGTHAT